MARTTTARERKATSKREDKRKGKRKERSGKRKEGKKESGGNIVRAEKTFVCVCV